MNVGDVVKHYKGGEYVVLAVGKNSETMEDVVTYQNLSNGSVWVRPLRMFEEHVQGAELEELPGKNPVPVPRFEKIDFKVIFLDQYQDLAFRTAPRDPASYPEYLQRIEPPEVKELVLRRWDLHTWTLGLAGEAGEFADYLKKVDGHGHAEDLKVEKKELGDVSWYSAAIARVRGFKFSDVATFNIKKLMARYPNGFEKERSLNRQNEI